MLSVVQESVISTRIFVPDRINFPKLPMNKNASFPSEQWKILPLHSNEMFHFNFSLFIIYSLFYRKKTR